MLFKCPVCKGNHTVPDNYDNKEYICQNGPSRAGRKTFQDMTPNDLLEKNNPLMNRSSTRIDVQRPATILVAGPDYRPTGEKIGQLKRNW